MDIKDVIHNKRIEHGMTMKDLASAVGVSEGTISRWESGEISNMRRDKVARLVETFVARVDVYKDKAVIYYNITEKRAASGVRIRPVTWSSRTGIRTPRVPFVFEGYYILVVPYSHAA